MPGEFIPTSVEEMSDLDSPAQAEKGNPGGASQEDQEQIARGLLPMAKLGPLKEHSAVWRTPAQQSTEVCISVECVARHQVAR